MSYLMTSSCIHSEHVNPSYDHAVMVISAITLVLPWILYPILSVCLHFFGDKDQFMTPEEKLFEEIKSKLDAQDAKLKKMNATRNRLADMHSHSVVAV